MTDATLTLDGLDALPAAERQPIVATLTALLTGFATRDADVLDGLYTEDADWVNAFGSVKRGNRQIVDYLRGLFADRNFNDGVLVAPPRNSIKRISDEVAIVSTHLQVTGQRLIDGEAIDLRDNHSLRVLHKQPDGAWRIASEMYMDVRRDQSYVNHS